MAKRKDGFAILAEYLAKYQDLDTVIEQKDERILYDILKYEANLDKTEFAEVFELAVKSGLSVNRCLYCGDEIAARVGRGSGRRRFCEGTDCLLLSTRERMNDRKKAKALKELKRRIKNIRDRKRKAELK